MHEPIPTSCTLNQRTTLLSTQRGQHCPSGCSSLEFGGQGRFNGGHIGIAHRTLPCMQAHALQESSFQVSPSCLAQKRSKPLNLISRNGSTRRRTERYLPRRFCPRTCRTVEPPRPRGTGGNNVPVERSDAPSGNRARDRSRVRRRWPNSSNCIACIDPSRIDCRNCRRPCLACTRPSAVTSIYRYLCTRFGFQRFSHGGNFATRRTFASRTTFPGIVDDPRCRTMQHRASLLGARQTAGVASASHAGILGRRHRSVRRHHLPVHVTSCGKRKASFSLLFP